MTLSSQMKKKKRKRNSQYRCGITNCRAHDELHTHEDTQILIINYYTKAIWLMKLFFESATVFVEELLLSLSHHLRGKKRGIFPTPNRFSAFILIVTFLHSQFVLSLWIRIMIYSE